MTAAREGGGRGGGGGDGGGWCRRWGWGWCMWRSVMVVVGGSCRGWEGPARLAAAAARRQRLVANDGGLPRAVPAAAAVSAVAAGVNINNKNATGAHRMGPAATRSAAGHRTPPSRRASRASHPRPADDRDNGATPYPQGKGRAPGQKAAQRPARQTHAAPQHTKREGKLQGAAAGGPPAAPTPKHADAHTATHTHAPHTGPADQRDGPR